MAIGRERPELEDQLSGFDALRLAIALGLLPAWSDAAARAATIAA
jgi:hypothetical protein